MHDQRRQINQYVDEVATLVHHLSQSVVHDIIAKLLDAYYNNTTIYIVGNGGSAATASHFACDLQKWTITPGHRRVKAIALTDNMALFSAYANDDGYEHVFAAQLETLLEPGDVVVAISGSGKSPNVLRAVEFAASRQAYTIGLTGFDGGELVHLTHTCLVVPSSRMNQIEDIHMLVCHLVADVMRIAIVESQPLEQIALQSYETMPTRMAAALS